jgi:Holliday junction DNA helicase RuvA
MIGQLRGVLVAKQPPFIVIDVQGVGYELQASMTTIYALPAVDQHVLVYTHMVVREDAQLLYAFIDESERAVFRQLIKVSGIGPKLALSILSGMSVNNIMQFISMRDSSKLTKIPGVGKKIADRLIVEMQGKLVLPTSNMAQADAVSALVALGYKQQDAHATISKIAKDSGKDQANSETLIRAALQALSV